MDLRFPRMSFLLSSYAYSCADPTAENASVEILQNGMDGPR